jgi:hypothetical protein
VRRITTSTPLQALVLLNDPQYLEAARALAESLWREYPADPKAILLSGFERLTGRLPEREEQQVLLTFFQEERQRFSQAPEEAAAYLNIGEKPPAVTDTPSDLAALTTVMHGVMNTTDSFTLR